jgi:hypothetical protein
MLHNLHFTTSLRALDECVLIRIFLSLVYLFYCKYLIKSVMLLKIPRDHKLCFMDCFFVIKFQYIKIYGCQMARYVLYDLQKQQRKMLSETNSEYYMNYLLWEGKHLKILWRDDFSRRMILISQGGSHLLTNWTICFFFKGKMQTGAIVNNVIFTSEKEELV